MKPVIVALVRKELRESAWMAGLALLAGFVVVNQVEGRKVLPFSSITVVGPPTEVPFTGPQLLSPLGFILAALALALGFSQSAWAGQQGTYLFLLHRPVSRNAVFLTKLAAGLGLLFLCGALPVLAYAWWAATPGNIPAPFEWGMTASAWRMLAVLPLLYMGAFLSGLRPARWVGTRLLPLAATAAVMFPGLVVAWPLVLLLPALAVLYAILAGAVCYAGRVRDYA